MKNLSKKGLSAIVAFTFMFANSLNVVAQKTVAVSDDNVAVTKSSESGVLFIQQWFLLNVSDATDETNPAEQIIELALDPTDSPNAPCDEPTGTPCAVRLTLPSNMDAEDLQGLSVQEATALTGVDYANGATNSYTHKTP